jgi:hypothetical protein
MDVPIEVVEKILPALRWFLDMAESGEIESWRDTDLDLVWERADWAYHELKKARENILAGC